MLKHNTELRENQLKTDHIQDHVYTNTYTSISTEWNVYGMCIAN